MRPLLLALLAGCTSPGTGSPPFPAPDAWGGTTGPGAPRQSFAPEDLFQGCATLSGGPEDSDHHNLALIWDGWLVHPWSPEYGSGGLTLYDLSEPCAPQKVGQGHTSRMRESHTLAFGEVDGRTYVAVDSLEHGTNTEGGVGFWDITDPTAPTWVSDVVLPGIYYPDAYVRVTLSTTWVGDIVYAPGGVNGVYLVDATDPLNPVHHSTLTFPFPFVVGSFHVIGSYGIAAAAGVSRFVVVDLSDPWNPAVLPAGMHEATTGAGGLAPFYFSNVGDRYLLLARKFQGGGPILYDISDPSAPEWVGEHHTEDGDGGYVALHEDWLFVGDSHFGSLYDISDPSRPVELDRFHLKGDLDTVSPVGNVAVVSVDDGADPGEASIVVPWRTDPDTRPPRVGMSVPAPGAVGVSPTAPIGVLFNENIEPKSVFAGSFRVHDLRGRPVSGRYTVKEATANFVPDAPLDADRAYILTLPAGGVTDVSGNAMDQTWTIRFHTAAR